MKIKKIGEIDGDGVYIVGKRAVLHAGDHLERVPYCQLHSYKVTKLTLSRLASGRARSFRRYDVTYPRKKEIQIGCKTIPLTLVRKALKALS